MNKDHATQTNSLSKLFLARLVTENGFALLLQYLGLMLCSLSHTTSMIWLASGTAIALTFMRGAWVLPGIGLGSVLAYYFAGAPLITAVNLALIYVAQTSLLFYLCQHWINPTLVFASRKRWLAFLLLSASITAAASFAIIQLTHQYGFWLIAWLANLNGIWIIGCALTTWDMYFPELDQFNLKNNKFLITLFIMLFAAVFFILFTRTSLMTFSLVSMIFLLNLLISLRSGWAGIVCANFLFGLALAMGGYFNTPLFTSTFSYQTISLLMLMLSIEISIMNLIAI